VETCVKININIFSDKEVKQLREIAKRLDAIEEDLEDIKRLLTPFRYLPVELEKAVRKVSKSADVVDRKVPDLEELEE
jgi:hypothetical protein